MAVSMDFFSISLPAPTESSAIITVICKDRGTSKRLLDPLASLAQEHRQLMLTHPCSLRLSLKKGEPSRKTFVLSPVKLPARAWHEQIWRRPPPSLMTFISTPRY